MRHGPAWHLCQRWEKQGLVCPFPGKENLDKGKKRIWPMVPRKLTKEEQRKFVSGGMLDKAGNRGWLEEPIAAAEEVVARGAREVPVYRPVYGRPDSGRTLREALEIGGATTATGIAAAWAIRQVVQRGRGGGFHFPSILDPRKPQMAR